MKEALESLFTGIQKGDPVLYNNGVFCVAQLKKSNINDYRNLRKMLLYMPKVECDSKEEK